MDGTTPERTAPATDALIATLQSRLADGQLPLPTLPDLALRIDAIVGAEGASAAVVAAAISQDPATAARLIAAANSAYAAGRVRVQSMQGAVTRLGLAYTRALVHRVALEQMFLARTPRLQRLARHSWNRSLEVAALSEALARQCTDLPPETAMIAGLLHQIGILPMIRLLDTEPTLIEEEQDLESVVAAVAPKLGRVLLAHWSFPRLLQDVPLAAAQLDYEHRGAADIADLVLTACYGHLLTEDGTAEAPIHALDKLRLDHGGAFLQQPAIASARESARQRLDC